MNSAAFGVEVLLGFVFRSVPAYWVDILMIPLCRVFYYISWVIAQAVLCYFWLFSFLFFSFLFFSFLFSSFFIFFFSFSSRGLLLSA